MKDMQHNMELNDFSNEMLISDQIFLRQIIEMNQTLTKEAKIDVLHYALHAAKKAKWTKRAYYVLSSVTILFPLVSNVLLFFSRSELDAVNIVCIILSAGVSMAAASLSLFKFHDKWTRYRNYTESSIGLVIHYLHTSDDVSTSESGFNDADSEQQLDNRQHKTCTVFLRAFHQLNKRHHLSWQQERDTDAEPSREKGSPISK